MLKSKIRELQVPLKQLEEESIRKAWQKLQESMKEDWDCMKIITSRDTVDMNMKDMKGDLGGVQQIVEQVQPPCPHCCCGLSCHPNKILHPSYYPPSVSQSNPLSPNSPWGMWDPGGVWPWLLQACLSDLEKHLHSSFNLSMLLERLPPLRKTSSHLLVSILLLRFLKSLSMAWHPFRFN